MRAFFVIAITERGDSLNNKINSIIKAKNQKPSWVQLFGYTSKGIPGVDIIGLNSFSKSLKEKLIFLSRENNLSFSMKRYVLCFERHEKFEIKNFDLTQLELPFLILFWSLSGHLPITRLDNCLAFGQVGLDGRIRTQKMSSNFWFEMNDKLRERDKKILYFGNDLEIDLSHIKLMKVRELFLDLK